ncbi:type II secretion system F family protein [Vibrio taketomensis]|uniref:type II secretion system F family protein n=1 Tax=Vibrio taketomensis TaxID=2572923 RepID=UPI001576AA5B|nr:type II secretion system F family protein [Vibrio taketomensis]
MSILSYANIALCLIGIGLLALVLSLRQQRKQQTINKYLAEEKSSKSQSLSDWLEVIVPKSLSVNEQEIQQKLHDAGNYSFKYAHLYLPFKYALLVFGSVTIGFIFYGSLSSTVLLATIALWVIAILLVPDMILQARIKAYQNTINRQLPYLIDLLAVCVQTGMTIESSLSYLANEMQGFDSKLAQLLQKTNERANIVGLDKALDEAHLHIPTPEMRSFVMTLKQSLRYGSSIYSTLTTLSADIRQVSMLTTEEKIGKLAAKMSVPLILFIMMPIVILIAAPGVMRMLSGA